MSPDGLPRYLSDILAKVGNHLDSYGAESRAKISPLQRQP